MNEAFDIEIPYTPQSGAYRFDGFTADKPLLGKKKGKLPPMGWNSWNAFGSGNTETLTKEMADKFIELGLDKLGYRYLVLDDGCYLPERIAGKVDNEKVKFPNGFRALADYIHGKGLKFGMYNDVGTNLCAGAAVGTCGHEEIDAQCYVDWGVDFLKVDNCYYPWDNATFSNAENARYVYAPNIKCVTLVNVKTGESTEFDAVKDGILWGQGAEKTDCFVKGIGTFDGTGPDHSPVGELSSELRFDIKRLSAGEYDLNLEYATGREVGTGSWLQIALGLNDNTEIVFDGFLPETETIDSFVTSEAVRINISEEDMVLRFMNHRRQENTLCSYAKLLEGLNKADKNHDIILSLCEWGKTQPHQWGWKVGDSWRILNDITFRVGADGDPGHGDWESDYTPGVAPQYNKAVIMDEFSGLDKGWNDPDMMMIGMDGLDIAMCETHMSMWCMLNAPLMLGLDLRRVKVGDDFYRIITNKSLIKLNQDELGIQAKRIYCSIVDSDPSTTYVRDNKRVDVLAKPLSDGSVALAFYNLDKDRDSDIKVSVTVADIVKFIGAKMVDVKGFENAASYEVINLWTNEMTVSEDGVFGTDTLPACGNLTVLVKPVK